MKVLITEICGFVRVPLAKACGIATQRFELFGINNFSRLNSEVSRVALLKLGVPVLHPDLRHASDIDALPESDWFIDTGANSGILADISGLTSSRQLVEHNLVGTINLLEYCKRHRSGFILLSTNRIYFDSAIERPERYDDRSSDRVGRF